MSTCSESSTQKSGSPVKSAFLSFLEQLRESYPNDNTLSKLQLISKVTPECVFVSIVADNIMPYKNEIAKRDENSVFSCGLFDKIDASISHNVLKRFSSMTSEEKNNLFDWYDYIMKAYETSATK
jgi:hypothetical protein